MFDVCGKLVILLHVLYHILKIVNIIHDAEQKTIEKPDRIVWIVLDFLILLADIVFHGFPFCCFHIFISLFFVTYGDVYPPLPDL